MHTKQHHSTTPVTMAMPGVTGPQVAERMAALATANQRTARRLATRLVDVALADTVIITTDKTMPRIMTPDQAESFELLRTSGLASTIAEEVRHRGRVCDIAEPGQPFGLDTLTPEQRVAFYTLLTGGWASIDLATGKYTVAADAARAHREAWLARGWHRCWDRAIVSPPVDAAKEGK